MRRMYRQFLGAAALAFIACNVSAEESLLTCDGENFNLLLGSTTKKQFSLMLKKEDAKLISARWKEPEGETLYTVQGNKCGGKTVCTLVVQSDKLIFRQTNQETSEDYDLVLMNSGEYSGRVNQINMSDGRCAARKVLF